MIPRLVEEEANRVIALALAVLALLALPFAREACDRRAPPPALACASGAHRDAEGRIACGEGEGEPLSTAEALLIGTRIDLNRATAEDLEIIPGLGETRAREIVEDRGARGAFGSIDDLARVRGIGKKTLERVRPYLRAAAQPEASTADERSRNVRGHLRLRRRWWCSRGRAGRARRSRERGLHRRRRRRCPRRATSPSPPR
jgi:competence protein ComEA